MKDRNLNNLCNLRNLRIVNLLHLRFGGRESWSPPSPLRVLCVLGRRSLFSSGSHAELSGEVCFVVKFFGLRLMNNL